MNLEVILKEFGSCKSTDELELIKKKYIWKKWILSNEFKLLKDLSPEEKKTRWQELSALKQEIDLIVFNKYEELYKKQVNKVLSNDIVDISLDKIASASWWYGIQPGFIRNIEHILQVMWFNLESWNEIVSKYQNFESVNIPKDHPAVEMHDTFYLDQEDWTWDNLVMRTQTSSWQNKILKKYWAPCKVMVPWKVFRCENTDASHDSMFWQLEWIVVWEDISLSHLIWFLEDFLSRVFGEELKIRLRPAFFPFVEPWFEWDVSCPVCSWNWCSLCKQTWWLEIFWTWMIHPNVLKEWWIDPSENTGFAFWMWIARIIALKYSIKDIRLFNSWDLRFFNSAK